MTLGTVRGKDLPSSPVAGRLWGRIPTVWVGTHPKQSVKQTGGRKLGVATLGGGWVSPLMGFRRVACTGVSITFSFPLLGLRQCVK